MDIAGFDSSQVSTAETGKRPRARHEVIDHGDFPASQQQFQEEHQRRYRSVSDGTDLHRRGNTLPGRTDMVDSQQTVMDGAGATPRRDAKKRKVSVVQRDIACL